MLPGGSLQVHKQQCETKMGHHYHVKVCLYFFKKILGGLHHLSPKCQLCMRSGPWPFCLSLALFS